MKISFWYQCFVLTDSISVILESVFNVFLSDKVHVIFLINLVAEREHMKQLLDFLKIPVSCVHVVLKHERIKKPDNKMYEV